jgi:hypothetical protein
LLFRLCRHGLAVAFCDTGGQPRLQIDLSPGHSAFAGLNRLREFAASNSLVQRFDTRKRESHRDNGAADKIGLSVGHRVDSCLLEYLPVTTSLRAKFFMRRNAVVTRSLHASAPFTAGYLGPPSPRSAHGGLFLYAGLLSTPHSRAECRRHARQPFLRSLETARAASHPTERSWRYGERRPISGPERAPYLFDA